MIFDEKTHKVKWWLLSKDEARAYLYFLGQEQARHICNINETECEVEDIDEISHLVCMVKHLV